MKLNIFHAHKRAVFICAAAVLLGSGVFIMARQNEASPVPAVSPAVAHVDQFEEFRTERQQLRAMQKAQINEIIYSEGTDTEIASMAQRQLLDMLRREEQEGILEGLIAMRGFDDVIVSIQKDSVSVFAQAEVLTQQECSMILDLVCRETGLLGGNIKIIPVN